MITLQRHVIGALVRHFQLTPGALGAPFYGPLPDAGYAAQVAQWYESLPPASRLSPEAFAVLAAPDLVSDVRVFQGRGSLTRTWAMARLGEKPGPFLLAAPQGENGDLKIEVLDSSDAFSDTLLTWLIGGSEPSEPELNVRLTQPECAILLALADLYSRDAFSSYIAHRPVEDRYSQELIARAYHEAVTVDDPRWLLSFALPLLDDGMAHLDGGAVAQALQGLHRRGLIEPAGQDWKFTIPGEYVALSFHRRTVTVAVDTIAADVDGRLGTHAALLLRSDEPLWFINLPVEGEAALTGISLQAARDILDALFTPLAKAPLQRPPAPQTAAAPPPPPGPPAPPPYSAAPAPPYAAQPPYAGAPYAAPPAGGVCPACGQPVVAGAVFCGNCGARIG